MEISADLKNAAAKLLNISYDDLFLTEHLSKFSKQYYS